jgi:hypothetical protein
VRDLMERITFTEFLDWVQFLDQEERSRTKLDWYLAQVAAEIRLGNSTKTVNMNDFFVTYMDMQAGTAERMKRSKMAWGGAVNLDLLKDN